MLIYDIEISKAIPPRSGALEEGIEYCGGWNDHRGMGIAVIGCYDYKTDRYRVFCEDNLNEFGFLAVTQECVVGFNNHRFDDHILEAHDILIPPARSYDILQEIWHALGLGPDYQHSTHAGYGLDAMCRANFKTAKTGNGATAPIDWQRGKIGSVVDYCLNDIHLTKRLLDKIIRTGTLANPVSPSSTLNLRKPSSKL